MLRCCDPRSMTAGEYDTRGMHYNRSPLPAAAL